MVSRGEVISYKKVKSFIEVDRYSPTSSIWSESKLMVVTIEVKEIGVMGFNPGLCQGDDREFMVDERSNRFQFFEVLAKASNIKV